MNRHQFLGTSGAWTQPTPHKILSSSIVRHREAPHPSQISFLERLKSEPREKAPSQQNTRPPTPPPQPEPATLNPTAAFFNRLSIKNICLDTPPTSTTQKRQNAPVPAPAPMPTMAAQTPSDCPTPEARLAVALRDDIALEAEQLHHKVFTELGSTYNKLKDIMATTSTQDNDLLKAIDSQYHRFTKPLSDTTVQDQYKDAKTGKVVTREIHIGTGITSFRKRIDALEAEVHQLWDQWEAMQEEVDAIFGEVTSQDSSGGRGDVVADVGASLAADMEAFGNELGQIIEETSNSVKAQEKDFKKQIDLLLHAMVQQFMNMN